MIISSNGLWILKKKLKNSVENKIMDSYFQHLNLYPTTDKKRIDSATIYKINKTIQQCGLRDQEKYNKIITVIDANNKIKNHMKHEDTCQTLTYPLCDDNYGLSLTKGMSDIYRSVWQQNNEDNKISNEEVINP